MVQPPDSVPDACPGTSSDQAGKADACNGCPNQDICATTPKGPDPDIPLITERLSTVQRKILILSGKGGVGKSTVTSQLAFCFGESQETQVGVLDIDICGPSIPTVMGVEGEQIHQSNNGWTPVYVQDNIAVMSIGFLLEETSSAVIWGGPKKNGMIKQFLKEVDWQALDYLLVDTPPGTSDEHLSIIHFLSQAGIDGAVLVTTPQEVAIQDVRKEATFCQKVGIPILGVIENMTMFICPKCAKESVLFPPSTGGAKEFASELGVPFLGSIPLDPRIGKSCDSGLSILESYPEAEVTKIYRSICQKLMTSCPVSKAVTSD